MKKIGRYVFAALLLVATIWLVPVTTHAASAPADSKVLTITPASTKPVIDPGSSASGSFQVVNQGTTDYPVKVYAAPYTVHSEAYTPDFTAVPGKLNAANWLQFNVVKADVAAGKTLNIDYTVTVPAGTKPGGYYAVAFVETQSSGAKQGVVVNERVGEIFYIQVAGPVKQSGKLLTWSSSFLQEQPLTATLRLENDGSLDYASSVHIVVKDLFGRPKYSLDASKEVLPQTIRSVPITWTNTPMLGLFKVTGTITVPGKTQTLATHYVLVISPLVRILGVALIALLLAFSGGKKIGRYKRKTKTKVE